MKDKILLYWNSSSYLIRSVMIYTLFSVLAIISKLLGDNLGFLSSMIAMGFLMSLLGVIASMIYVFIMSMKKKVVYKEIFLALFVLILFLFLMSLVLPPSNGIDNLEQQNFNKEIR